MLYSLGAFVRSECEQGKSTLLPRLQRCRVVGRRRWVTRGCWPTSANTVPTVDNVEERAHHHLHHLLRPPEEAKKRNKRRPRQRKKEHHEEEEEEEEDDDDDDDDEEEVAEPPMRIRQEGQPPMEEKETESTAARSLVLFRFGPANVVEPFVGQRRRDALPPRGLTLDDVALLFCSAFLYVGAGWGVPRCQEVVVEVF